MAAVYNLSMNGVQVNWNTEFGADKGELVRIYGVLDAAGIPMAKLLSVNEGGFVREDVQGVNGLDLAVKGQVDSRVLQQLEDMSEKAAAAGYNLDYFPENFVVKDGCLIYVGLKFTRYLEEYSLENWGLPYWSRSPELELYLQEYGQRG